MTSALTRKPRLLDLFSGAGGAAVGYARAGFDVTGIDIRPQPHFPFRFIQGDALNPPVRLEDFDVIHASPPCQAYSTTRTLHGNTYPSLVEAVRDLLQGHRYVIENVVGAPLDPFVVLCGSAFGLDVRRHRRFESNLVLFGTECRHDLQPEPIDVTGTGGPGGRHRKPRNLFHARDAIGIDWMNRPELSQAVPPSYTYFVGTQLLNVLVLA